VGFESSKKSRSIKQVESRAIMEIGTFHKILKSGCQVDAKRDGRQYLTSAPTGMTALG
jgi:hypothetical protein